MRTEPKSQASTYFSLNNAVRHQSIKLSEQEQTAYATAKMATVNNSRGESQKTKLLDGSANSIPYCKSYSRTGMPSKFTSVDVGET